MLEHFFSVTKKDIRYLTLCYQVHFKKNYNVNGMLDLQNLCSFICCYKNKTDKDSDMKSTYYSYPFFNNSVELYISNKLKYGLI